MRCDSGRKLVLGRCCVAPWMDGRIRVDGWGEAYGSFCRQALMDLLDCVFAWLRTTLDSPMSDCVHRLPIPDMRSTTIAWIFFFPLGRSPWNFPLVCLPNLAFPARPPVRPSRLVPYAPRPVVRQGLLALRLQFLHGVVQEEVDQDRVDLHLRVLALDLPPDLLDAPDGGGCSIWRLRAPRQRNGTSHRPGWARTNSIESGHGTARRGTASLIERERETKLQ